MIPKINYDPRSGTITGIPEFPGAVSAPPSGQVQTITVPGTEGRVTDYQPIGEIQYFDGAGNPISRQDAGPRHYEQAGQSQTSVVLYDAEGNVVTDPNTARARMTETSQRFLTPGREQVVSTTPGFDPNKPYIETVDRNNPNVKIRVQRGETQTVIREDNGFDPSNPSIQETRNGNEVTQRYTVKTPCGRSQEFVRIVVVHPTEYKQTLQTFPPEVRKVITRELEKRGDIPPDVAQILLETIKTPFRSQVDSDRQYRPGPRPVDLPPSPQAVGLASAMVDGVNTQEQTPVNRTTTNFPDTTGVAMNRRGAENVLPGATVALPQNQPDAPSAAATGGAAVPRLTIPLEGFTVTEEGVGDTVRLTSDNTKRMLWDNDTSAPGVWTIQLPEGMSQEDANKKIQALATYYHSDPVGLTRAMADTFGGSVEYFDQYTLNPEAAGSSTSLSDALTPVYYQGSDTTNTLPSYPALVFDSQGNIFAPSERTNPQFYTLPQKPWSEMSEAERLASQEARIERDPSTFVQINPEHASWILNTGAIYNQDLLWLMDTRNRPQEGYIDPLTGQPAITGNVPAESLRPDLVEITGQ